MSNDYGKLIARLDAEILHTVKVDVLHQEVRDALTAQARELEALKLAADNAEGMAGCMAMFRNDMIEAGVITESVAPMFMTEAILSKLSELRADAERYRWLLDTFCDRKHGLPQLEMAWDDDQDDFRRITFWGIKTPEQISAAIDAAMQSGKAVTP